ncbi:hypothetical protein CP8484711_1038A, partial [Chlamydia psittaci 84-8471/1]
MTPKKRNFIV